MRFEGCHVAGRWSRAARRVPWQTIWIAKSPIPAARFRRNLHHQSAKLLSNAPRNQLLPELHRLPSGAICLRKIWLSFSQRIATPDHQSQTRLLVPVSRRRNAMPDFAQPRLTKGEVRLCITQAKRNNQCRFFLNDDVKKKRQIESRRPTREKLRLKILRSVESQ